MDSQRRRDINIMLAAPLWRFIKRCGDDGWDVSLMFLLRLWSFVHRSEFRNGATEEPGWCRNKVMKWDSSKRDRNRHERRCAGWYLQQFLPAVSTFRRSNENHSRGHLCLPDLGVSEDLAGLRRNTSCSLVHVRLRKHHCAWACVRARVHV